MRVDDGAGVAGWSGRRRGGLAAAFALFGVLLFSALTGIGAPGSSGGSSKAKAKAKSEAAEALGGTERYRTHVSTDKPIYRIGDTVYVRAVVLEAHDYRPRTVDKRGYNAPAELCVKGPQGETLKCASSVPADGAVGFQWRVPDGQAGGQYKVLARWPAAGLPPSERDFEVRAFRAPRLRQEIQFAREGYGPSSRVEGTLSVQRAEGGIPAGASVTVQARVDGVEIFTGTTKVDGTGAAPFEFTLPSSMDRGEGSLTLIVEDGGVRESTSKTIPILLQTLDIAFFPEGGELVETVENRVYLEARTPWGKPADIEGRIVDSLGVEVARYRTKHEGRGAFTFTPRPGETYALRVDTPAGITRPFPLPSSVSGGVALRAAMSRGGRLAVQLESPTSRDVEVVVSKIDEVLTRASVSLRQGRVATKKLSPRHKPGGTLTVTVFGADGTPLAERLVFAEPRQKLKITVKPERKTYAPGDRVKLELRVRDENGKPAAAVLGTTVSDAAVADLLEDRDLPPNLATMALLESDVAELRDADLYLSDAANASEATDLLLGTQGWRRFAVVEQEAFRQAEGDRGRRVLAFQEPRPAMTTATSGAVFGQVGMPFAADMLGGLEGVDAAFGVGAVGAGAGGMGAPPADGGHADPRVAGVGLLAAEAPKRPQPVEKEAGGKRAEAKKPDKKKAVAKAKGRKARAQRNQKAPRPKPAAGAALMEMKVLGGRQRMAHRGPAVVRFVREYAHKRRANWTPKERVDFADTVFWSAAQKTDKSGRLHIEFDLSDSVSSFAIQVGGYSKTGRLGSAMIEIDSVEPFYAEPKLPLEVTRGDRIELPIAVVNATDSGLGAVKIDVELPKGLKAEAFESVALAANQRKRVTVPIQVGKSQGGVVTVAARAGDREQTVQRPLAVVPQGFPVEAAASGMLRPDEPFVWQLAIPSTAVAGSQTSNLAIFASPSGNLTAALERMIREPHGCFEQTSSTTYPLVMAQQYFKSHSGVDPSFIERSRTLIDKGYKRLTGFECKKKGYEWFGADPGHEALSAYGLLEFSDMAKVHPVDSEMLERTRQWLLSSRDGSGGFERKRRALHTWVTDADASDAYILWALLESGTKPTEILDELDSLSRRASVSKNSYVTALAANVLQLAGRKSKATDLMRRLAEQQAKDGAVAGATTSIVGSGGRALTIETTSLAILAWLRDPAFLGPANKAVQWLSSSCEGGRYGSTQSTVLALRAIIAFDAQAARATEDARVTVVVNGRQMGSEQTIKKGSEGVIQLADIAEVLEPGIHTIEVRMKGGSPLPVALSAGYFDTLPPSSEQAPIGLKVTLRDPQLREGRTSEVAVSVQNRMPEPVPNPVAIIGLPGGVEADIEALKELVSAGTISAYETRGREVILYWRDLGASAQVDLNVRVQGAIPGTYTGPASRAYLYYSDENKEWHKGLRAEILADATR